MPYSFTQIEKEKSRAIFFAAFFLIIFYFITAWLIYAVIRHFIQLEVAGTFLGRWRWLPSGPENLKILLAAAGIGLFHFWWGTADLLNRMLGLLGARTLNPTDTHHQVLQNVIDEVSVATGGKRISGRVIPTHAMNAFAVMDFEGRAVIGVTEGLLARLPRHQLEAVIGHEAAHIVSGDCLETTVISSLFGIYDSILNGIESSLNRNDDSDYGWYPRMRLPGVIYAVYGLLVITRFMSALMRMFISRQREFRADAVAVRLTRDPMSLAQALYAIAFRWRGGGLNVDQLSAIFIVNPQFSETDENEGIWADLFSTHPPVRQRLNILLGMARSNLQELEAQFRAQIRTVDSSEVSPLKAPLNRWMVCDHSGQWKGLYTAEQLRDMDWFSMDMWIKKEGGEITPAYWNQEIIEAFKKTDVAKGMACPHCQLNFVEMNYEGVQVQHCGYCAGNLVLNDDDLQRIIIRKEMRFPERVRRLADTILKEYSLKARKPINLRGVQLLSCPVCAQKNTGGVASEKGEKMLRGFYTLAYPVEIDRCVTCGAIWFDRDELEILQYLIEEKTIYDYI